MTRLTKQYIKDLEAYEYNELRTLERIKYNYEKEGNTEKAKTLNQSINYQMGRWGVLNELLETLGIEEKLSN